MNQTTTDTVATIRQALWHADNESYLDNAELTALWSSAYVREAGLRWAEDTDSVGFLYDHPNYGSNGLVAVGVLEVAIEIAHGAAAPLQDMNLDWTGTTIDDDALTELDEFLRNPSDKGPLGSTCLDEIVDMFTRARAALRQGELDDDTFDDPDDVADMIGQVEDMTIELSGAIEYVKDAITRVAEGGEV